MITVEETRDRRVVMDLIDEQAMPLLPDIDVWFDHPEFIYLVAKENDEPKLLAMLVRHGTETEFPEVHFSAKEPWMHIFIGCRMMKKWVRENTDWKQVWSFTLKDNIAAFEFAKALGFNHAFDEDNRRFIVLNLNN